MVSVLSNQQDKIKSQKSKTKYLIGDSEDPCLKKAREEIEKIHHGSPVKFTEIAEQISWARPNLMKRAEKLITEFNLIKRGNIYYKPETKLPKANIDSMIKEYSKILLETKKKNKKVIRLYGGGKTFETIILPAKKQDEERLIEMLVEINKILKKYELNEKMFIGMFLNFGWND